MALIEREAAKARKVYCEERHEYVVPVAELDWLPTIDPIRAVGGCRCGECRRWQRFGGRLPDGMPADWGTCTRVLDPDSECEITTADGDFCSYGEPREAKDDG